MAVEQARLEPGITYIKLIGHVTIDDLAEAQEEGVALAASEPQYVLIIDLSEWQYNTPDFRKLRALVANEPHNLIGRIIVAQSNIVQFIIRTLSVVIRQRIHYAPTLEAGIIKAREILTNS
ncbi:MAG: hypothetical protein Kow00117_15920 [Phototrophicales bacterium]